MSEARHLLPLFSVVLLSTFRVDLRWLSPQKPTSVARGGQAGTKSSQAMHLSEVNSTSWVGRSL